MFLSFKTVAYRRYEVLSSNEDLIAEVDTQAATVTPKRSTLTIQELNGISAFVEAMAPEEAKNMC